MKNLLSLLRNIISYDPAPTTNVKNARNNLFSLYDKIEKYYSPGYGAKIHIFKHPRDMDTLLKIIPEHAHHYLTQFFYNNYAELLQEYKLQNKLYDLKEKDYPDVFFSWRNEDGRGYLGSWGIYTYHKEQEYKIKTRYNKPFTHYHIRKIKDTELFKGGVALRQIIETIDKYYDHPEMIQIIDQLSTNQDFIDFTVKCQTIANEPEVFQHFLTREDDWHNAFFAPIHFVNDEAFSPFKPQTIDLNSRQSTEERLDEIMTWSSSKLHTVEIPVTHRTTIADDLKEIPFDENGNIVENKDSSCSDLDEELNKIAYSVGIDPHI